MTFDSTVVINRIAHIALSYVISDPEELKNFADSADASRHVGDYPMKSLDAVIEQIKTYLADTSLWATHPIYAWELTHLQGQLEIIKTLNNPACCETWIDHLVSIGEEAHNISKIPWLPRPCHYSTEYRELLHVIRLIILENILGCEQSTTVLNKKADELLAELETTRKSAAEARKAGVVSDYEKNEIILIRKLCWMAKTDVLGNCQIVLIKSIFPEATNLFGQLVSGKYRYFKKEKASKRQLENNPLWPIVLARGANGLFCYHAKKHHLDPNQLHKDIHHSGAPEFKDDLSPARNQSSFWHKNSQKNQNTPSRDSSSPDWPIKSASAPPEGDPDDGQADDFRKDAAPSLRKSRGRHAVHS